MRQFYDATDQYGKLMALKLARQMRMSNPDVDVLLAELKRRLQVEDGPGETELPETPRKFERVSQVSIDELADLVAKRVWAYIEKRLQQLGVNESVSVCGNENGIAKWRSDVETFQLELKVWPAIHGRRRAGADDGKTP